MLTDSPVILLPHNSQNPLSETATTFLGGTCEKVMENLDGLMKNKPDNILMHVGTNDITNGVNLLNSVKKIVKQFSEIFPRTAVTFSSILVRKDKLNVEQPLMDTNTRLKR